MAVVGLRWLATAAKSGPQMRLPTVPPKSTLRKHLPGIEVSSDRAYSDAGSDQLRLHASSIAALTALLQRRTIAKAAWDLLLRLMRARPTIYAQYHCPDLADAVLSRTRTPARQ